MGLQDSIAHVKFGDPSWNCLFRYCVQKQMYKCTDT